MGQQLQQQQQLSLAAQQLHLSEQQRQQLLQQTSNLNASDQNTSAVSDAATQHNLKVNLMAFPLPSQFASAILHCELHCDGIDEPHHPKEGAYGGHELCAANIGS